MKINFFSKLVTTFLFFMSFSYAVSLPDFTVLAEQQGSKVVNISSIKNAVNRGNQQLSPQEEHMQEFFNRFGIPMPPGMGPNDQQQKQMSATGSGFILESDGYIITNAHVVGEADSIIVKLADKREFQAKLLGIDKRTDVALLKIDAKNLPSVKLGNPKNIKVGEWVLAIGSPFGLENTVTAGIVSALGRDTGDYLPFIQTDVAVNPGNSGGPLLNLNGEVIGINSQIYSRTGGFMGISFAIPIDEANLVAGQLKKTGRVIRGRIGVLIGEVTKDVADALGFSTATGAMIRSVDPEGPSSPAGIKPGDIVLKFQGRKIKRVSDLPRIVGSTKPGTFAKIEVWRKGKVLSLKVKVDELKSREKVAQVQKQPIIPKTTSFKWMGLSVMDVPQDVLNKLGLNGGVAISSAKGISGKSGLVQGDIIVSINNRDVSSVAQFSNIANKLDKKKVAVFLIRRGGEALFITVKP